MLPERHRRARVAGRIVHGLDVPGRRRTGEDLASLANGEEHDDAVSLDDGHARVERAVVRLQEQPWRRPGRLSEPGDRRT